MTKHNAISSKVKDIEQLRLYPLPTQPIDVARAVRVDRAHVLVDTKGRIYSSEVSTSCYWARTNRVVNTLAALERLRLLSAEAIAQHRAFEAEEKAANEKRWASESILDNALRAGIKLTTAQIAKLQRQVKSEDQS